MREKICNHVLRSGSVSNMLIELNNSWQMTLLLRGPRIWGMSKGCSLWLVFCFKHTKPLVNRWLKIFVECTTKSFYGRQMLPEPRKWLPLTTLMFLQNRANPRSKGIRGNMKISRNQCTNKEVCDTISLASLKKLSFGHPNNELITRAEADPGATPN